MKGLIVAGSDAREVKTADLALSVAVRAIVGFAVDVVCRGGASTMRTRLACASPVVESVVGLLSDILSVGWVT